MSYSGVKTVPLKDFLQSQSMSDLYILHKKDMNILSMEMKSDQP